MMGYDEVGEAVMATGGNKVGFVSSYNPETGMASVVYPDRGGEVTDFLPVLAPFGVKQGLKKGDAVLVTHLSNNYAAGIIIGGYMPGVEADVWVSVSGSSLVFHDASGTISLSEIIANCRKG